MRNTGFERVKTKLPPAEVAKLHALIEKTSRRRQTKSTRRNRRGFRMLTLRDAPPSITIAKLADYLSSTGWDVEKGTDGYLGGRMTGRVYVKGPVEYYSNVLDAVKGSTRVGNRYGHSVRSVCDAIIVHELGLKSIFDWEHYDDLSEFHVDWKTRAAAREEISD